MRIEPYIRTPQIMRGLEPRWAARMNACLGDLVESMPPLRLPDVQLRPEFAHVAVAPAKHKVGPHLHTQVEIFRLDAGTIEYRIGERAIQYRRGDIAIIPSPLIHEWHCEQATEFFGIMVAVVPESASEMSFGQRVIHAAAQIGYRIRRDREIDAAISALKREISQNSADSKAAAMSYLQLALTLIFRKLRRAISENANVGSVINAGRNDSQIMRALAFIRAHLSEPLAVAAVANSVGLSGRHLNRLFKQAGHESINAAIERARLDHASWLLRHSDHSIKAIARLSGFCDAAYFCRVFKRKRKVNPSAARGHAKS